MLNPLFPMAKRNMNIKTRKDKSFNRKSRQVTRLSFIQKYKQYSLLYMYLLYNDTVSCDKLFKGIFYKPCQLIKYITIR